jgi:hypothetical protein
VFPEALLHKSDAKGPDDFLNGHHFLQKAEPAKYRIGFFSHADGVEDSFAVVAGEGVLVLFEDLFGGHAETLWFFIEGLTNFKDFVLELHFGG